MAVQPLSKSKPVRARKSPAIHAIGAHKIRIAESADSPCTIPFKPVPQVAPRKTQKYRGAPGPGTLALQGVVNLLDLIAHWLAYRS